MSHEGGYAEAYVPFCGLAVVEELADVRTKVEDPLLEFIKLQQPGAVHAAFIQQQIEAIAQELSLP